MQRPGRVFFNRKHKNGSVPDEDEITAGEVSLGITSNAVIFAPKINRADFSAVRLTAGIRTSLTGHEAEILRARSLRRAAHRWAAARDQRKCPDYCLDRSGGIAGRPALGRLFDPHRASSLRVMLGRLVALRSVPPRWRPRLLRDASGSGRYWSGRQRSHPALRADSRSAGGAFAVSLAGLHAGRRRTDGSMD